MESRAVPISASERILTIDVVRGFALLGIFIMNMPWFNTSFFVGADGSRLWPEWWNVAAETIRDVLFAGKFNSMFSLLFAVGFTIQLDRLEERDPDHALPLYLRRLFWLFVFGAIHACFFWTGDILHIYAIFGLLLLALRHAPERLLWTLFASCVLYTPIMGIIRLIVATPEGMKASIATANVWVASNNAAYGHGSFLDAAREHMREMAFLYTDPHNLRFTIGFYILIFTTTLLGLMLGRRRFFQNSAQYLPTVRRVQWWALGLGILTGAVYGFWSATVHDPTPTPFRVVAGTCFVLCRLAIMVFYVTTIIRCVHNEKWRRRLAPMSVVGRMPLSNYLLQTLIATSLFYGWGLGWWGKVGPALDLVLAFAIFFAIQVPLSHYWLKRHALGPMEYLWRLLTYGRTSMRGKVLHEPSTA
jgi:uncharacterized protein